MLEQPLVMMLHGNVVSKDDFANMLDTAMSKIKCLDTAELNRERIYHFRDRIGVRGLNPSTVVIVVINVDAPYGQPLTNVLMPNFDWQQFRDQGMIPYARGLATRAGVVEYVRIFEPEVAEYLANAIGPTVLVIDHGTAISFEV